jgi:hypothetical protein
VADRQKGLSLVGLTAAKALIADGGVDDDVEQAVVAAVGYGQALGHGASVQGDRGEGVWRAILSRMRRMVRRKRIELARRV